MTTPISVEDFINKASPSPSDQAIKAMVITSARSDEPNASSWMAEEATQLLRDAHVEVATYSLTGTRIHPCVGCYGGGGRVCMHPCDRNDIESDIFQPNDGMGVLYEQLIATDILILATDVRWGGLNHYTQRFIERLNPFVNQAAAGKPLIKDKLAGLLIVGDGALSVTGQLMMALNAVGFIFPRYGYSAWHVPRSASADATKAAFEKSTSVHHNTQLLVADCVSAVKGMRGA